MTSPDYEVHIVLLGTADHVFIREMMRQDRHKNLSALSLIPGAHSFHS